MPSTAGPAPDASAMDASLEKIADPTLAEMGKKLERGDADAGEEPEKNRGGKWKEASI